MARKRMLIPEFWGDDKILELKSSTKKLVYLALISRSDDESIQPAGAHGIQGFIRQLPLHHVRRSLEHIEDLELAVSYTGKRGQKLYLLPNFQKHQRLDHPQFTIYERPPWNVLEKYPQHLEGILRNFRNVLRRFQEHSENVPRTDQEHSFLVKYRLVKDSKD